MDMSRFSRLEFTDGWRPSGYEPTKEPEPRIVGDISEDAPPVAVPEPTEPSPEELRRWEIWTEGYAATGQRAGAAYHGQYIGATWDCAVSAWASKNRLQVDFAPGAGYTFWGCRVFDNEAAARASFG